MKFLFSIYNFVLCFTLFSSQLFSSETFIAMDFTTLQHEYVGQYIYEGDSNGDFKGDYAVVLSDGSRWKIHPKHNNELANWNIGDKVHVGVRTTSYWIKREHKFTLVNHDKNSELFVMLLETPWTVTESREPVPTTKTTGFWPFPDVYGDYEKGLVLSDKSKWMIKSCACPSRNNVFKQDTTAYVGYNVSQKETLDKNYTWGKVFIINGTGKDAIYEWVAQTGVHDGYIFFD